MASSSTTRPATDTATVKVASKRQPKATSAAAATPSSGAMMRQLFEAVAAKDIDGLAARWDEDTYDDFVALNKVVTGTVALRAFFTEYFAAVEDADFEIQAIHEHGDTAIGQWRLRGTFSGGPFNGIHPTGKPVDLRGIDVMRFEDGIVRSNTVYYDGLGFARQIGLLPADGSRADRVMLAAFNTVTGTTAAIKRRLPR